jgi:exodeoxyribonuclease V alpha subunit
MIAPPWPLASSIEASPHQCAAWESASARGGLAILTGGPGTGKTHTAAAILKQCAAQFGLENIAVCSPFGKAAVRITAAMQAAKLDKEATTIHRMLGVSRNGHDGAGWGFRYNLANPLPYRVVAVEESSTLGVDLGASLFAAFQPGTLVLLLGDPGQLPPVEHGAPLRDMLAAGVPHGELSEIWRNAGDIVKACQAIRRGERWEPSRTMDIPAGHNLRHIETIRPSISLRQIERLLGSTPPGLDPVWDIQVLCIVNEKGPLCRQKLNEHLRGFLNPKGRGSKDNKYREGDKVICLSNSMLPVVDDGAAGYDGDSGKEFVANGEIGRVLHVEPKLSIVRFDTPARTVKIAGDWHDDFDLAYAITTHKSIGSEWPVVFYVSDEHPSARRTASRQLIYTAISRSKKLCVTIGRKATMDNDCLNDSLSARKTFLAEMIRGAA